MEQLLYFTWLFLPALFCDSFGESGSGHSKQYARSSRSMQHPAFSMMMGTPMVFPGSPMQGGSRSGVQSECITEDIVCPAWCLMEDEWGCKYCPCGPANGMSPAKVSEHRHSEIKHEEGNDCIGTILCMLSCKDGYKLGPRDSEHGCQPCTCVKKNETKADNNTGHSTNSEPCAWPLCMNGNGPNNGPGKGASMTSLPIGGVKAGGSLPGVDCIGAACSAKNGMHTMENASPAMKPLLSPPQTPTTSSFPRPITKRPQSAGHVYLPTRKALLLMSSTTKSPSRLFLAPVPTEAPSQLYFAQVQTEAPKRRCATLEFCMNSCQYGFQVQNSRQECPDCSCILPSTISTLTIPTTPKPDFIAIMRVCPDAVHCMKSCTQGYTLTSSHSEKCPICTCNREPKALLLCERPLSCPNGCTVGYRGDEIGCPTCNCVAPSETRLRIEVHTTRIDSALTCNPQFSCVDKCLLGYKTGDNGCPTCVCLEPATGGQYQHPVAVSQIPRPQIVQPSSLNCIGPQCSAIHAVPQRLQLLCERPLSCPYGCTVGFKCDNEGCPICSCIAPSETSYQTEVQNIVVERVLQCDAKFSCQDRCAFGFKTGADGCPSCACLQPVTVKFDRIHDQQPIVVPHYVQPIAVPRIPVTEALGETLIVHHTGINVPGNGPKEWINKPSNDLNSLLHAEGPTNIPDVPKIQTVMEACPETVKCMVECGRSYKLTQRVGEMCPDCKCIHDASGCTGPSCSAPGSHRPIEEISTPAPGECVAILHCVMTCKSGYDIGEYSSDGCPSCTCVQ